MGDRIDHSFFETRPTECARALLGCELFWDSCAGIIVETEAYNAEGDPACHTFFRPSSRRFVAEEMPGTAYVYLNYGVHWLFNILVRGPRESGFILIRALRPTSGQALMAERRGRTKEKDLCSGPGKLTQALGVNGSHHSTRFLMHCDRGIRAGSSQTVVADARIGISRGQELPWRYTVAGSSFVSRRPRSGRM